MRIENLTCLYSNRFFAGVQLAPRLEFDTQRRRVAADAALLQEDVPSRRQDRPILEGLSIQIRHQGRFDEG